MANQSSTTHMLAMLTLSVLAVGCSGQFVRDTFSRTLLACGLKGSKLITHVIGTHTLKSKLECSRLCLEDAKCTSLNWKTSGGLCELNSSDKTTDAASLVLNSDFFYWAPDNCPGYTIPTTTTTTVPTTTAYQCLPPDKTVSDRCVSVDINPKTWANADTSCKTKAPVGSWSLLTFEHGKTFFDQVISQLFTAANEDKDYWIGLHEDGGTWKWTDPASTPLGTPEKEMWYMAQTGSTPGITCATLAYKFGTYKLNGFKRNGQCTTAKPLICQKYT
ncbi:pancreatic beta cell growth factor-like [Lineus longissimus]|uniref:pancreatic beta cell growth factor-like n=1 Tax=Lineus longissimus TaxID=88925 RepID=UPI002B4ECC75